MRVCRLVKRITPLFPLYTRFYAHNEGILGAPVVFHDLLCILERASRSSFVLYVFRLERHSRNTPVMPY